MATTRKNLSTSLQLGFADSTSAQAGALILKTFSRINPDAADEAVKGAADDLTPLYDQAVSAIYRVDSYALQAA